MHIFAPGLRWHIILLAFEVLLNEPAACEIVGDAMNAPEMRAARMIFLNMLFSFRWVGWVVEVDVADLSLKNDSDRPKHRLPIPTLW